MDYPASPDSRPKGWPGWIGMTGRNQSESVAGMRRNTHRNHELGLSCAKWWT